MGFTAALADRASGEAKSERTRSISAKTMGAKQSNPLYPSRALRADPSADDSSVGESSRPITWAIWGDANEASSDPSLLFELES